MVGTFIDITVLQRAEGALRESEARFRSMFEQATVGIVEIFEDRYLRANPGFCELVGYSEDELKRTTVQQLCHPEDYSREKELMRQLTAGEIEEFTLEKRYLQKQGETIWATKTATVVRGASGEPSYILAIVAAIGDRKRAEEQLRMSEERFRQFAENSADVFWILNAATHQIEYVNPVYEKMWGESRESLMQDPYRWLAVVHPDDHAVASSALPRVLAGEVVTVQYRIVRPSDGETRWIRGTGFPIRNEAGKVYRLAGVAQDVTEDRAQAEALRRSEEHFRLLVEGARDYAMFSLNLEGVISFWSKGAERIFGWSQEEAIGQSAEIIFTPEDRANGIVEKEMKIAWDDGRALDRRFHLRQDGSRFWADGVLMRLDDEQGEVRGFAKVARDATDQRAIEDALRQARDEMEQHVIDRTKDLLATNRELERTMRQRQELEKELLEISEREKRRIGEDLHDMVCQELTATALFLKSSATRLAAESPAAAETLEESAQIVNRNVGLTRDLARGLQPAELTGAGLKEALRSLAEQACETTEIKCQFKVARGTRVTDDTIALNIYRVAQEAVTNAIKHAGAKHILITLDHNPEHICVTVEDDGKGFVPGRRSRGLGLHIMRYRTNALGGELKIAKRPQGGMEITCKIPLKK